MSTLKATYLQNASSATVNMTNDTSGNVTVGGTLAMTGGGSFLRNRIINGDMRIDQRNAGASVTPANGGAAYIYALDRWAVFSTQNSKFSAQQNAGSVTPPAGYSNYLGVTSLSAATIAAGDIAVLRQSIEAFNTSDLNLGVANALSFTVSFWVRSSLTGTFGGAINNSAITYGYPYTYAINSANTWEYKTITVSGPTAGTWLTGNNTGLSLFFNLGCGSTYVGGTAGTWGAQSYFAPSGTVNLIQTNGATFYITGVQLEVGSVATPFERRQYGQELALCQRYYFKTFADGTAPAQNAGTTGSYILPQMVGASTTQNGVTMAMPVAMRAMTTVTLYNPSATNAQIRNTSISADCSSSAVTSIGGSGYFWGVSPNCVTAAGSAAGNQMRIHFTVDGEL